jgi:hypothetical protein
MRYVCQRNSKLPKEVQNFNIELLANDLNKLGFNIRLTDSKGNRLSNDKICNEVYKSRPDVEGVCMANNGSVNSTRVAELVKYFNSHFGTNIATHENPMDPTSKKRSIPDLCDDMYMVQDKISRKLSDNADGVKRSLIDQIKQLKLQQRILDESFGRHLNMLRRGPETGFEMDKIQNQVNETTAIRQALIGEMGRQIHAGTNLYKELESQLDSRFYPHVRHVRGVLDQYAKTPFDGNISNVMMQTNNMLSSVKALGNGIEHFKGCMAKLNITEEHLNDDDNYEKLLGKAYTAAKSTAGAGSALEEELKNCYSNLRHAREIIKGAIKTQANFRTLATDFGTNMSDQVVTTDVEPDVLHDASDEAQSTETVGVDKPKTGSDKDKSTETVGVDKPKTGTNVNNNNNDTNSQNKTDTGDQPSGSFIWGSQDTTVNRGSEIGSTPNSGFYWESQDTRGVQGGDNRDSFWVDADASESAFVY